MRLTRLFAAIISFSLLFLNSCKEEECNEEPKDEVIPLNDYDTSFLPYNGVDSILFQRSDSSGILDTVLFVGKGREFYTTYKSATSTSEGCLIYYWKQALKLRYISTDNLDSIILLLYQDEKYEFIEFRYRKSIYTTSSGFIKGNFGWDINSAEFCNRIYYNIDRGCYYTDNNTNCERFHSFWADKVGLLRLRDFLFNNYEITVISP